jgi:hypothetical protein
MQPPIPSVPWEDWRNVPECPDYMVSSLGRVASLKNPRRPREMTRFRAGKYEAVFLMIDGRQRGRRVHRVVGEAFLGPLPSGMETRHINGVGWDNRLENLAYGTHLANEADKRRHGTHHLSKRTHCPRGHLFDEANTYIYRHATGVARVCRTCKRPQIAAAQARRRERLRRQRADIAALDEIMTAEDPSPRS